MHTVTELARRFFCVLDDQDWDLLRELVSPHARVQVGSAEPVAFSESQNLEALYRAFPDGRHVLAEYLSEGDRVATRGYFTGTQLGPFLDRPATGVRVKFSVTHFDRFAEGVLVEPEASTPRPPCLPKQHASQT